MRIAVIAIAIVLVVGVAQAKEDEMLITNTDPIPVSAEVGVPGVVAVEIINQPEPPDVVEVEILNLPEPTECPAPSGPLTFMFLGFTEEVYSGNLGGLYGAAQKCEAEFPGTNPRMCDADFVRNIPSPQAPSTLYAWFDRPESQGRCVGIIPVTDPDLNFSTLRSWTCDRQTTPCYYSHASGNVTSRDSDHQSALTCEKLRPIACCGYASQSTIAP